MEQTLQPAVLAHMAGRGTQLPRQRHALLQGHVQLQGWILFKVGYFFKVDTFSEYDIFFIVAYFS